MVGGWVSRWVWVSEWVSEWMSEWVSVSEWVNEWVSECEWVSERSLCVFFCLVFLAGVILRLEINTWTHAPHQVHSAWSTFTLTSLLLLPSERASQSKRIHACAISVPLSNGCDLCSEDVTLVTCRIKVNISETPQKHTHTPCILYSFIYIKNCPLLPRHWASSDCGWRRRPSQMEGSCVMFWISSCGQLSRGGPPAWGLGGANNPSP
jgi:hypothetical protein